jgi:hypothetical protein
MHLRGRENRDLGYRVSLGYRRGSTLSEKRDGRAVDLFDCDGWFPSFVFVEDGETDCARGIDIRMEQRRIKFTSPH